MPELPEVETIIRELQPAVTGKTLEKIIIYWQRSIEGEVDALKSALEKKTVLAIKRLGKYILITFDQGWTMTIHLRMTGRLIFNPVNKDKPYIRVKFLFNNNCTLYFVDIRKFGKIQLWQPGLPVIPLLGPEPLEPGIVLKALLNNKSRRTIKSLLLDQHFLAGVGNIYADESLFASGIHPSSVTGKIPAKKIRDLSRQLPRVLSEAINNMGTTLSDYRTTTNQPGKNQFFLQVYGRLDQPCKICSTLIKRIRINKRSSHFCPKCQPQLPMD